MNEPSLLQSSPVVIGGVGGSGTRLVTHMLLELGFYMGEDLNESLDNLWFTLLFKRLESYNSNSQEFLNLLGLFLQKMIGSGTLTTDQVQMINNLAADERELHSSIWLKGIAKSFIYHTPSMTRPMHWGWKEPNSHIVIDRLQENMPNLRYIHVIRNGLDMAFSSNQNQVSFWGNPLFNKTLSKSPHDSLKFWVYVHKRMIKLSQSMAGNFLILNYDDLCRQPDSQIIRLSEFLNIECDLDALKKLIQPPLSIGRYKKHSLDQFDSKDIEYVQSLGFDISIE